MPRQRTGTETDERLGPGRVAAILFACVFAAQSGQLALTPVLASAAQDLGVSTSAAGQLRTVAAVVAAAAALAVAPLTARLPLRTLLWIGLGLLAAGAALSSLAQGLALLAAGQALGGAASSVLIATGVSATAVWTGDRHRGRVLAWALAGAPAAWVVAMPVIGIVAATAWRLAFVVAIVAAAVAALALRHAPGSSAPDSDDGFGRLLRAPGVRFWAIGEVLSYSAWSGVLVYAGALFVESYGASVSAVGWCLGLGAAAYIPGTFLAHRVSARRAGPALAATTFSLALCVVPFGGVRLGSAPSAVAFGALCFLAGARAFLGSSAGLDLAPSRPAAAMSLRAAAAQLGSIVGAGSGGAALSLGGFSALTAMFVVLFAGAAVLQSRLPGPLRERERGHATRPARRPLVAARARAR
jgi:MFS transporter, DHA1 family, inner membrane transport protein